MTLLCLAEGVSIVTERIFPDRFMHVAELLRLGARIRREGAMSVVEGVERLSGAPVMASDLRASAHAYIRVRRCDVERLPRASDSSGIPPQLGADCTIDWITVREKKAA